MVDQGLARSIIPKDAVVFTSVCQVKPFEGYAAITIVAYIIFGLVKHEWTVPLGPIDKLIEVTLIALLWQEDQQSTMPSQQ